MGQNTDGVDDKDILFNPEGWDVAVIAIGALGVVLMAPLWGILWVAMKATDYLRNKEK